MVRTLAIAAFVLTAPAAFAQGAAAPEQVAALVAAITEAGCAVTPENNAAILAAAGLDEAQAAVVVSAMLGLGQAEIVEGNLKLKTEGCQ